MVTDVYALVQQNADKLQRTFKLIITFYPGDRMPSFTCHDVSDEAPGDEASDAPSLLE